MNSYQNETRSIPTPKTHPCTGAPTPSRRPTMLPWAFFIGNIRAAAVKNGRGSLNLVKRDVWIQHGDDGRALRCSLWVRRPISLLARLNLPLCRMGSQKHTADPSNILLLTKEPPTQTGCPKAHSNSFCRAPNAISTAAPAAAPSESDGHSGGIGWFSIVGSTEGMGRGNTGSRENNGFHTNPMTRNQSHDPKPPLPT
jgi:hypothetical protein